jgi:anti-sigma factor RsiW
VNPTCQRVEGALALFVGDDLDDDEAALVRRHLLACDACRATLEGYRAAGAWLRSARKPEPGPAAYLALQRAVRVRVREAPRPWLLAWLGRGWSWVRLGAAPTLATATVALALGAFTLVARGGRPPLVAPPAVATDSSPTVAAASARPEEGPLALADEAGPETAEGEADGEPDDDLRIEMQTSDPEVRIIWFSPRPEVASASF